MSTQEVPPLGSLTTEEFRQKLAGVISPETVGDQLADEHLRNLAVQFAAILPRLFGDELDRKTLWERIGSGLQSSAAKTAGDDCEYFVQQVLSHIKAPLSFASGNEDLRTILHVLGEQSPSERERWMRMFQTHLIPILVHAREKWDAAKKARKEGAE